MIHGQAYVIAKLCISGNRPMLIRTLAVLDELRRKTINCHLPPPDGRTTLGVARGVLDFVDDLNGALSIAAGAIEKHYFALTCEWEKIPFWVVAHKT
jgi:hypothetical protein